MRRGTTVPELVVVLTVVGVLVTIALTRARGVRDRVSVRAAASETVATFALARRWSLSRASRTAITFDTMSATAHRSELRRHHRAPLAEIVARCWPVGIARLDGLCA